ncbi:cobalamin B12-binding domain-containing protein [Alkalicoccus chagannorensis]|uniref:cobalamin B12-binding domain-containing protein n=1 Tax=Alkalicoccus chagannorensis TaxID=427072 RepID=UPI0004147FEE|nr:cobalamin-dependent protein [Alkalicoccus chagannorensis]
MDISTRVFIKTLLEGDHGHALAIVKKWRASSSRLEVYRDLITPAMYDIGLRWQHGDITVAQEHLATGVCDFVLSQTEYELVSQSKSIDATPKAFFFTVENEHHYLGLKMVSILFRERNWNVRFLQSDLPVREVLEEAERWNPQVIGLSFSLSYRVEELTGYLQSFSARLQDPQVLIGGRLVSQYDFSSIGSLDTTFIEDLNALQRWFIDNEKIRRDEVNGKSGSTSII